MTTDRSPDDGRGALDAADDGAGAGLGGAGESADVAGDAGSAGPGGRALAVLAMERRRYRHQGAKEQAVRDELGLSAARYHQLLNALLDDPAALAADPVLVNRLRRLRHARTADLPR